MELMEAIRARRAVRDFKPDTLERSQIEAVIAAGAQAPSAMNLQPWLFAVIQGADVLRAYSDRAKAHLLATIDTDSPLATYRPHLADPAYNIFYGAPAAIIVCARNRDPQAIEDSCLAAQNLMLAAWGIGLGTCWIGFARPWLSSPATLAELRLPPTSVPVAPIVIGKPRSLPVVTPRRPAEVIWL
jgi:nitroreductase